MTPLQKLSIFDLVLMAAMAVAVVAIGLLTDNWQASMAGFALISLRIFGRMFFKPGPDHSLDERDQHIVRRADLIGYRVFWISFVLGCVGIGAAVGFDVTIPVVYLAALPFPAAVVLMTTRAVSMLVLYGRGA